MSGHYILNVTAGFSVIIPTVAAIYTYRRLRSEMKILLILFILSTLEEFYEFYKFIKREDTHLIQHFYTPLEYGFLALVFSFWQENRVVRNMIRISIPIFILVCLMSILALPNLENLNSFTASLSSLLYVILGIVTLINIHRGTSGQINGDFRFWISSAIIIYAAGSLVYFAFHDYFFSWGIWSTHAIINIITNAMFGVGFICQYRQQVLSGQ